jgi:predicted lipoprotein with Yx(FWY)xxD motif
VGTRLMRRALALLVLGTVGATLALTASAASVVTVKSATNGALGAKILVSSTGLTLYHYVPEKKGKIACTGACATDWPPLVVTGKAKPVAAPGVTAAKLGTIKRPDGRMQVTYNGLALYRYSDDAKTGQAKGQGEGGIWYAVTPAGTVTKAVVEPSGTGKSAASTSSGTSSSTSGSSSSGGGGGADNGTPSNCTPGATITDPGSPCYNY